MSLKLIQVDIRKPKMSILLESAITEDDCGRNGVLLLAFSTTWISLFTLHMSCDCHVTHLQSLLGQRHRVVADNMVAMLIPVCV